MPLRLIHPTMGGRSRAPWASLSPIFDSVVAGAGVSGLALAAAVKQAAGERGFDRPRRSGGPAPRQRNAAAHGRDRRRAAPPPRSHGAWETIEPKAQAIVSMVIMDGEVGDAVRLPHLNIAAKDDGPLAHMAFNDDVVGALGCCDRLGVSAS